MKAWLPWLGMLGLGLLLAGCQSAPAATPTVVVANLPTATARAITPTRDPRPTNTPVAPSATPVPTKAVDYCVDCHTSKDKLTANLKPTVTTVKESEGSG